RAGALTLLGVCGHHFVIIIGKESSKSFGRLWNLANLVNSGFMHPALATPALDIIDGQVVGSWSAGQGVWRSVIFPSLHSRRSRRPPGLSASDVYRCSAQESPGDIFRQPR